MTSTESGYLTSDTESSVNIFVGNEQINKDRVRNGIQVPHLIESWGQSSSAYLGIVNGIPNPQNHMTSKGVIRSFGNFLVAGNLKETSTAGVIRSLPGVVRTSDVAVPGSVPQNWNPFAAGTNTADEFV